MPLSQFAAYADILTSVAVLVSLGLVFLELRRSTRENRFSNWLETTGRLYDFRLRATDPALSDVILRGRKSLDGLSEAETEAFQKYLLSSQIAAQGFMRMNGMGIEDYTVSMRATRRVIKDEWDHPGPRMWWDIIRHDPPIVPRAAELIDDVLKLPRIERGSHLTKS